MSFKLRIALFTAILAGALGATAVPAMAVEQVQIDSFATNTSSTEAGDHPDFETEFTIGEPGVTQSARNVAFNAPEGLFGDPRVVTQCSPTSFALQSCPYASQIGLITIYANYQGNPNNLLGTAPIFDMDPGDNTALFAFIVPKLGIPISIPVAVRTASDYGLRFTVSQITQNAPLAGARLQFWGFPADNSHENERFATGSPGHPAGCPDVDEHLVHQRRAAFRALAEAVHAEPDDLHGRTAGHHAGSRHLPEPEQPDAKIRQLPDDHRLRRGRCSGRSST